MNDFCSSCHVHAPSGTGGGGAGGGGTPGASAWPTPRSIGARSPLAGAVQAGLAVWEDPARSIIVHSAPASPRRSLAAEPLAAQVVRGSAHIGLGGSRSLQPHGPCRAATQPPLPVRPCETPRASVGGSFSLAPAPGRVGSLYGALGGAAVAPSPLLGSGLTSSFGLGGGGGGRLGGGLGGVLDGVGGGVPSEAMPQLMAPRSRSVSPALPLRRIEPLACAGQAAARGPFAVSATFYPMATAHLHPMGLRSVVH